MRALLTITAGLALGVLVSCTGDEPCTPELYAQKYADLVARVSAFSTKDPAKRDAVIDGLYAILDLREAAGTDDDPSAICKAIDDLMDKLSS